MAYVAPDQDTNREVPKEISGMNQLGGFGCQRSYPTEEERRTYQHPKLNTKTSSQFVFMEDINIGGIKIEGNHGLKEAQARVKERRAGGEDSEAKTIEGSGQSINSGSLEASN